MINIPSYLDATPNDFRNMTEIEATWMAMCLIKPAEELAKVAERVDSTQLPLIILRERLSWAGVQVTDNLLYWLVGIIGGNPGQAVVWAWTLVQLARKLDKTEIMFVDYVEAFEPHVPTREARDKFWIAQKQLGAPLGNALDIKTNWEGKPNG